VCVRWAHAPSLAIAAVLTLPLLAGCDSAAPGDAPMPADAGLGRDAEPTPDAATSDGDGGEPPTGDAACPSGEGSGTMELLRTPDGRFDGLPDYPFEPHYVCVDDPTGEAGNRRIRVHYGHSGPEEAPTLLMLHGNPSWSYLFRRIIPIINDAGYRTVFLDYVGHGRSDKPANEADYTYDRQLEWIRQAVAEIDEDIGLRPVVLFGHDYGHPFGARLIARHYPDLFDGFINGNAGLNRGLTGLSPRHERWRDFVRRAPIVPIGRIICANPARAAAGLTPCSEETQTAYMAPFPSREYQASIRAFPEFVPEDPTWPEAQANQVAWNHLTSDFTEPYMVIWENADIPDVRRNRRAEYIAEIPGAFGHEQPQFRTGHYSPEDNPEGVAAAIIRFLDDIYTANTFTTVLRTDFSGGLDGVSCTGSGCSHDHVASAARLSGSEAPALVQDEAMDLTAADELVVAFRYLPRDLDEGDEILIDLGDGMSWSPVLTLRRGAEFDDGDGDFFNGSTDYGYVRLSPDRGLFAADARIRLRVVSRSNDATVSVEELGIYVRD
jgi:haloalkane dehalogenase